MDVRSTCRLRTVVAQGPSIRDVARTRTSHACAKSLKPWNTDQLIRLIGLALALDRDVFRKRRYAIGVSGVVFKNRLSGMWRAPFQPTASDTMHRMPFLRLHVRSMKILSFMFPTPTAARQLKKLNRQLETVRHRLTSITGPDCDSSRFATELHQSAIVERIQLYLRRGEHAAKLGDTLILTAALLQVRNELSVISLLARHRADFAAVSTPATIHSAHESTNRLRRKLVRISRTAWRLRDVVPISSHHRVRIMSSAQRHCTSRFMLEETKTPTSQSTRL